MCLCRRAGKLVFGFDAVVQELASPKSKAAGIILASDLSQKSEKEIRFAAEKYGCEITAADFTMDEVSEALGKRTGIFLVLDKGLYSSIQHNITKS